MIQPTEAPSSEETDNLASIRAVVDCPGGGRLITLGVPGLSMDHRGEGWVDPEALAGTLAELARRGTGLLVLLVRDDECPAGLRILLKRQARQAGLAMISLPIDDYEAPGAPWLRAWRRIEAMVDRQLMAGRGLALCCLYGAGRSGTVAAAILCRKGITADAALDRLRSEFPDSVESPVQEAWIRRQAEPGLSQQTEDEEP